MNIPHAYPDAIEVFGQIKKLRKFRYKDDIIHRKSGLGYEVRLILDDETLIIGIPKSKEYLLPVCIEAINGVNSGIVKATFTDASWCKTTFKRCPHSPNDTYLIGTVEASDFIRRVRYSASDIKEIATENLTRPLKNIAQDKAETKCARAAILREHLVLSPGSMPKGPICDALQALKPDAFQIVNLRLMRNDKGKLLSWREVGAQFKRAGKEGKSYTDERCRQIYTEAIKKCPVLDEYIQGLSKQKSIRLTREKTDAEEIEEMTTQKDKLNKNFEKQVLSDRQNSGYRITTYLRKPINLPKKDK